MTERLKGLPLYLRGPDFRFPASAWKLGLRVHICDPCTGSEEADPQGLLAHPLLNSGINERACLKK